MFSTKTCPCCAAPHGHSNWTALHASVFKPIRCKHCSAYFHHAGLSAWGLSTLIVPTSLLAALLGFCFSPLLPSAWTPVAYGLGALVALVLDHLLTLLYVDRHYRLAPGPELG